MTFRRDGAGGAVHSNERRLCEEAFGMLTKGPMLCEFLGGFAAAKKGRNDWVAWMVNDALSLHPNYLALLGWQGGDELDFTRERPELIAAGLRTMGYRLVPVKVKYPLAIRAGEPFEIAVEWLNRGVGRAMRDFTLKLTLCDASGSVVSTCDAGALESSRLVKGQRYGATKAAQFERASAGDYQLCLALRDPQTGGAIALPLKHRNAGGSYNVSRIRAE